MKIETRAEQPYAGIRGTVTMTTFAKIADRLGEIFGWLAQRGIPIAGAPFFRYRVIDMEGELQVEAGVPVAAPIEGEGDIFSGVLPAGRYATDVHHGHPDGLVGAWAALLAHDHEWDVEGDEWGCRTEAFLTDPSVEPDMNDWDVQIAVRLRMP